MIQSELDRLQKEGKVENINTPGLTIDELASRVDRMFTENQMSPVDKNDIQMFLYLLRGIKQHITSAPTNIPKNFLQQIEFYDDGTEKRMYLFINNAWTKIATNQLLSKGIAMFTGTASDLGGSYYKMSEISTYSVGSTTSSTTSVTTSPTLMGTFATISTYPNIVTIPVGTIVGHFETEKASGSNNYYTYFELYKRTSGGTETLIATSIAVQRLLQTQQFSKQCQHS